MKARVKATGEIVDVQATMIEDYDVISTDGVYFTLDQLELEQKHKIFAENCLNGIKQGIKYDPDYWTRLEHQAAIAAMQGMLSNPEVDLDYKSDECMPQAVAATAYNIAHALVEKVRYEENPKELERLKRELEVLKIEKTTLENKVKLLKEERK